MGTEIAERFGVRIVERLQQRVRVRNDSETSAAFGWGMIGQMLVTRNDQVERSAGEWIPIIVNTQEPLTNRAA